MIYITIAFTPCQRHSERYSLLSRTIAPVLLFLLTIILVACGSADLPATDCVKAVDGTMVESSCDAPEGTKAVPTATPLPDTGSSSAGDPGLVVFVNSGCGGCHAIDGVQLAMGQTGPSLTGVGSRYDADFIKESILNPNAVIAEQCPTGPCQKDIMPMTFGDTLSSEQIDSLVSYLSGLK